MWTLTRSGWWPVTAYDRPNPVKATRHALFTATIRTLKEPWYPSTAPTRFSAPPRAKCTSFQWHCCASTKYLSNFSSLRFPECTSFPHFRNFEITYIFSAIFYCKVRTGTYRFMYCIIFFKRATHLTLNILHFIEAVFDNSIIDDHC